MYFWKRLVELGKNRTPPKELNISYGDWCLRGYTVFVFDFMPDKRESMNVDIFPQVNNAPNKMRKKENRADSLTWLVAHLPYIYICILDDDDNNGERNHRQFTENRVSYCELI